MFLLSGDWQLFYEPKPVPWVLVLFLAAATLVALVTSLELLNALGLSSSKHDNLAPGILRTARTDYLRDLLSSFSATSRDSPESAVRDLTIASSDRPDVQALTVLNRADMTFRYRIATLRLLIHRLKTLLGLTVLVDLAWLCSRLNSLLGGIAIEKRTDLGVLATGLRDVGGYLWWTLALLFLLYMLRRYFEGRISKREARWNLFVQSLRASQIELSGRVANPLAVSGQSTEVEK